MSIGAWLIVVLLIPRIVRILYPEIWVEDDFYLESAWLVSVGMRPYLDFVHPHMPLLEWIAAGYLKLFGASYLSIEILNEAAIFATSLLTYALARRVAGRPDRDRRVDTIRIQLAGLSLPRLRARSFVAPLLLLGAIVTLDDAMPAMRQAAILAAIFFVACAIKLTAVIAFPVMLIFIAVAYRRIASAVVSGAIFALALAAFSAILYRLYGNEFIFQTFVFHFLERSRPRPGNTATLPAHDSRHTRAAVRLRMLANLRQSHFQSRRNSRARDHRRRVRILRRAESDCVGPQLSRAAAVHRDHCWNRRDCSGRKRSGRGPIDGSCSRAARC